MQLGTAAVFEYMPTLCLVKSLSVQVRNEAWRRGTEETRVSCPRRERMTHPLRIMRISPDRLVQLLGRFDENKLIASLSTDR